MANEDEQNGFRRSRSCVDQIFELKETCEKYLGKCICLYVAFLDLDKACQIDKNAI